jgi:zinc transporter
MMVEKISEGRAAVASASSQIRGQVLPGLSWAFCFHRDGVTEELAVDQPMPDQRDGWLWLHFNLADPRASRSLASFNYLPEPARESLVIEDDHQQLHADDACVYGVFADIVREGTNMEIGFIHFAMTERLLVSSRRHSLSTGDHIRLALQKGRKVTTVAALFEAIVEHVVDAVDDYAEDLAVNLDDVEERILSAEVSDERQTLGRIRRTTVQLHRQLGMSRSLIHRFERDGSQPSKPALRLATNRLGQRLDWLDTEIVALRDRAHLLQEEVTLKMAEQTNRHLEVLAIVATVFLPATLVAGVFGMNVEGLPLTKNGYGFVWSIGLIVGVSAVVFWLLRRTGVVGR